MVVTVLPSSKVAVEFSPNVILLSVAPLLRMTLPESRTNIPLPLPTEIAPLDVNVELFSTTKSPEVVKVAPDSTVSTPDSLTSPGLPSQTRSRVTLAPDFRTVLFGVGSELISLLKIRTVSSSPTPLPFCQFELFDQSSLVTPSQS